MSFALNLGGGEKAMVLDDRVVTLFIIGDITNNAPGIVTHILQGRTYEKPDIKDLEKVRAYLTQSGYKCLTSDEEAANLVWYDGVTPADVTHPEPIRVKLFVPTAVEIWHKPEPKQKPAVQPLKLPLETEPGDPWHCPECDTFNANKAKTCVKCDHLKPC